MRLYALKNPHKNLEQVRRGYCNVSVSFERIRLSIDKMKRIEMKKAPITGFFRGNTPILINPANPPINEIPSKKPVLLQLLPKNDSDNPNSLDMGSLIREIIPTVIMKFI